MTHAELEALIAQLISRTVEPMLAPLKERQEHQTQWQERLFAPPPPKAVPLDKGQMFGRIVRALIAGRGNPEQALVYARSKWGENDPVLKALSAGEGTAGGFLVPEEYSADIIELLRPMSVVRRLNPMVIPMDSGTMRMPRANTGTAASYVGESTNIAATAMTFGSVVLTWKKLAALVPISNDLLRYSRPSADTVVRDDVVRAMAQREDQAFIRDDGTASTPKGIRHWAGAANIIPANVTINLANTATDLGQLILALKNANIPFTRPAWMMNPRTELYLATLQNANGFYVFREEMLGSGKLWGWPYASSTQIPANLGSGGDESEIYLVDFADVVIGESQRLVIDSSSEASYVDADSGNLVSAYSRDESVVRVIAEHDLALRHPLAASVLTAVKWKI